LNVSFIQFISKINSLTIEDFSRRPENIQGQQDVFQESRT